MDLFPGRFHLSGICIHQKDPWLQKSECPGTFLQTFQLKEFHLIYSHIPVLNKIMASIRGVDALVLLAGLFFLCLNFKNNQEMKFRPTAKLAVLTVFCLVWGIFTLSGVSEFLYFNF